MPIDRVVINASPLIATLGTGGAIVLAKQRGLIRSAGDRLQLLQDAGLWLSEEVVNLLKQQAGE